MSKLCEGYTPDNTKKNTGWAVRVFDEWRNERSDACDEECPADLLESPSVESINYWLSRFVVECRRRDGEHYPSTTLYQLLAGLLRYSRSKSKDCPNFLDKTDHRFRELRGAVSRNLRKEGVGAEVKHASIFSPEEELKLWSSGAVGTHSPLALVRAVFFTLGKSLCLRGGQEHRELKPSQLR